MDQEYSSAAFLANLEIKPTVILVCERHLEFGVYPLIHGSTITPTLPIESYVKQTDYPKELFLAIFKCYLLRLPSSKVLPEPNPPLRTINMRLKSCTGDILSVDYHAQESCRRNLASYWSILILPFLPKGSLHRPGSPLLRWISRICHHLILCQVGIYRCGLCSIHVHHEGREIPPG